MMRTEFLLSVVLLAGAFSGCVVPENMTALREELGYASVELPDVIVRIRADTLEPRAQVPVSLQAVVVGIEPTLVSTTWTFGDGNQATGTSVDHTWEEPGTYTVNVTVQPPEGPAASDQVEVDVRENRAPVPAITVEARDQLVQGTPVVLSAVGTEDADGDPITYTWTVDGREAGTGPRLEQSFQAGVHDVRLSVTDGFETVHAFDAFAVALPLAHDGEVTVLEPTTDLSFTMVEGAASLSATLTHDTHGGLDDVRLVLLDASGDLVATADTSPELASSSATEELSVQGGDLPPGAYTLRAELHQGVTAQVNLQGLLKYST